MDIFIEHGLTPTAILVSALAQCVLIGYGLRQMAIGNKARAIQIEAQVKMLADIGAGIRRLLEK